MRPALSVLTVLLLAAVLAPSARAQASIPYRRPLDNGYGSYALVSSNLTFRQPSSNSGRSSISLGLQTSVLVPDGGEALLGGYSSARDGRNEFGTPVLGKIPIFNRGLNNVGYSRSMRSTRASVRVRIIRLEEEEERQFGARP